MRRRIREGTSLDAIEAVALEGLARDRSHARLILLVLLMLGIAAGSYLAVDQWRKSSRADWPVAVLMPIPPEMADMRAAEIDAILADEEQNSETAIVANATRQWQGFQDAFGDFGDGTADRHHEYFSFGPGLPTAEDVRIKLEALYQDGIRVFVITMSGLVAQVKPVFIDWAATKPRKEQPVLVATVASAPDIADRTDGVFRYFIRLEEETSVLATYLDTVDHQGDVTLFYVDDSYGRAANRILAERIPDLTYTTPDLSYARRFAINPGGTEADDIRENVDRLFREVTENMPYSVVVIIGYGTMISNMIEHLQDPEKNATNSVFKGTMLVASTFTEEAWRPALDGFADRIRTVGLVSEELNEITARERRGVVYQFSYLTLWRALGCRDARGHEAFWECWSDNPSRESTFGEQVEFTIDGDSIVTSLRLLRADSQ